MPRLTADAKWLKSLNVVPGIVSADYEYSGDRRTLEALKALPGASWLVKKWIEFWLEFDRSRYLGSAVRVSAKQFPEVHAHVARAAEILGIAAPPVFVVEAPYINAFTLGADDGASFLLVTRGLLEVATGRELMFILGHELGHVKSQHVLYGTMAIYLANAGLFAGMGRLPGVHLLVLPLRVALNAWFRRSEITCDRVGLIACQDLDAARKALLLTGCGSRELADRIDLEELAKQGTDLSNSYGKWGELFNSHPYMPKRVRAIELFAESHFYLRKVQRDAKSRFLDGDDLDAAVAEALGDNAEPAPEKIIESGDDRRFRLALALAGAWSDGDLSGARKQELQVMFSLAGGGADGAAGLRPYLAKPFDRAKALREIRHFSGDKLKGLPYAFSLVLLDARGVSLAQARLLLELCAACGLGPAEAEKLVYDLKTRKEFFRARAGLDLCARCSRLFEPGFADCPTCGTRASSLDEPEDKKIKTVGEKLDDLRENATRSVAAAGSALLGLMRGAADAAAPTPKKARKRKH